jgi:predicted small lipoprotein YifL
MDVRSRTATGPFASALATMVLATMVTLAGCGRETGPPPPTSGSAPTATATPVAVVSPEALLKQASRNSIDAPSKRLVGKASVSVATQEFDVVFVGRDAKGRQVGRALGQESVVEFVRVGDSLYIRASEAYWQAYVGLENLATVSGTWVRVPANHPNHTSLLVIDESNGIVQPVGAVTQVGTDTIGGRSTVVLTDGSGGRFFVSTEATPYLLRVEGTKRTEAGSARVEATFSDFGSVTATITAPSGKVVDLR